nr:hypothetical protein [Tanacetum cinerariifolium]
MQEDTEVQEVVEVVNAAKLMTEVATTAASIPIPAVEPAVVAISAAKPKVLKVVPAALVVSTRKRKGVVIRDPEEELHDDTPAEIQSAKDKGKGILVEDPKPMKKKDQIAMDAEYARKLQEEEESHAQAKDVQAKDAPAKGIYIPIPAVEPAVVAISAAKPKVLKVVPAALVVSTRKRKGVVIRYPEEELHDDTPSEIQSAKDKGKGILVEDSKPMKKKDQIAMDAEYARKLQEEEESHAQTKDLEVVADEDDDVFVEATLIGTKVPVVNYIIVMINNKPRYKIFRADDTHQLYTSFITLLKNFDREDLEDLWKIVKAIFSTSKPTNFTDDYLLVTLKNMFEKTDAQDVIWRSQQSEHGQALVKSWKLLTLCGVYIITFTTTMFVLLVEKKYPLLRFTLEQLVNVARLQVEEENPFKFHKEYLEKSPDAVTTVLPNEEPGYSLSMRYKHLNTTPKTESGVEELVPIPRECEDTSEDKSECDVLICEDSFTIDVCDDHSEILSDSNDDDILSDDDAFKDIEYFEASLPDPEIVSLEEENDVYQEEEEFLKELLIDDSIPFPNNESSNFEDDPSFLRPPLEPPDVEFFFDLKPDVIAEEILDE